MRHTAVDATAWLWCVINLGRTAAVVECCSLGSDQAVSSHLVVPVTNNDCRSHDGGHDLTDGWKDKNDGATYASVTVCWSRHSPVHLYLSSTLETLIYWPCIDSWLRVGLVRNRAEVVYVRNLPICVRLAILH